MHFSAYNGHARMVQVLVERYNCAPDRPEKVCGVNVVLLTAGYYCKNSPFVISFFGMCMCVAQTDCGVWGSQERPQRGGQVPGGAERLQHNF